MRACRVDCESQRIRCRRFDTREAICHVDGSQQLLQARRPAYSDTLGTLEVSLHPQLWPVPGAKGSPSGGCWAGMKAERCHLPSTTAEEDEAFLGLESRRRPGQAHK